MKNEDIYDDQSSLKKKILVVYTSSVVSPLAQPHGAIIVANILKEAGFDVGVACPFWNSEVELNLAREIGNFKPDMIAISIRNHGTAGFDYRKTAERSFYPEIRKIIDVCNAFGNIPIALGGSGFSVDPPKYMGIKGVSAGFIGNSEWELKEFSRRLLKEGRSIQEAAAGIGSVILPGEFINPILPSGIEPGKYSILACPEGIKAALAVGGTIPFRTKTGCSGKCSYCVMPLIEGRSFRRPENVVDEIRTAVEYHLGNRLFCADSEFGQDPDHDKAVCQSIIESGLADKIRINGYGDPFFMDEGMTGLMGSAGWKEVSVSADSFSPKMRENYRKRGDAIKIERGISNLVQAGIKVTVNILLGGPGETINTMSETLQVLQAWKEKVDICFSFGLTVFPNTPLEKITKRQEYWQYLRRGNGDFLPSFCSPCAPLEMVEFLELNGFSPARSESVIFWNEEADSRTREFCKKVIRIANGDANLTTAPESVLQQRMLEVAKLIQRGGD